MSLIKFFNWSYLKQNLKKSKGAIILCLIIVPLILSIYLVVSGIEIHSPEMVPQEVIGGINLFFMYVVPFVISVALFGLVFKKSSTDFINSMPINRTTMFITNTIGGILLITIIQLFSALIALLWGAIFTNLLIFPALIFDTMITAWISYIFVFSATNLAMTVSGTQQTQLLVTALILFLIPICVETIESIRKEDSYEYSYNYIGYEYDIAIDSGYQTTYFDTLDTVKNYTMPFKLFRYGIKYSENTNIRMIILAVIYFFLGLALYRRRKMEFSEESFSNLKLHMLAKGLTLVPVLLFVNRINAYSKSITSFVVAIILCGVYYIIFDIVSKRKVPIVTTIATFAGTIFVIQALITFASNIDSKQKNIDIEDIKAVSIGKNSNTSNSFLYYDYSENAMLDGNYFIESDQIIQLILDGRDKITDRSLYDVELEWSRDFYFAIKLKSGKVYYINTTIARQNYNEIMSILSRDKKYMKHIRKSIGDSDGIIMIGEDVVDYKTKKNIDEIIKNGLDDMTIDLTNTDNVYYITKSFYKNHKIVKYRIPLSNNNELLEVVAEFANRQALENIKGYEYGISAHIYNKNESVGNFYDDNQILDFMEEHAADDFDPSRKYYIISGGLSTRRGYQTFIFYTNETSEIDSIMEKENKRTYWY